MTSQLLFSVVDKEVVVTDLGSGAVVWVGRPLGRSVPEILQIPDEARAIILLDHTGTRPGQRENLIAINQRGEILWLAKLPTSSGTDFFGEMELLDEGVSAFSWSCHRVLIDPKTGETMDDRFTK